MAIIQPIPVATTKPVPGSMYASPVFGIKSSKMKVIIDINDKTISFYKP